MKIQRFLSITALTAAAGLCPPVTFAGAAHVHGHGQLDVAVLDGRLHIELRSPAMDIVGFEHAPRNATQRRQLESALGQLRNADALFLLPAAADCRLTEVHVESQQAPGAHDGEHDQDHHRDDDHGHSHDDIHDHGDKTGDPHSAVTALYQYQCENPAVIEAIDVQLFAEFPDVETLQVQLLTETEQRAVTLSADNTRIRL